MILLVLFFLTEINMELVLLESLCRQKNEIILDLSVFRTIPPECSESAGSCSGLVPVMLPRTRTRNSSSKDQMLFPTKDVPSAASNFTNDAIMTVSITLHARNPVVNLFCLISRHERVCCLFGLHRQSCCQLPERGDFALASLFRRSGIVPPSLPATAA